MRPRHPEPLDPDLQRAAMVEHDIAAHGVRSPRVLAALRRVPREEFVPIELRDVAYGDSPLPIADRQTISQPYIVAYMVEALELEDGDRVLEVGTGSGYAAAVLAAAGARVFTIERHEGLARSAAVRLERLGYDAVQVRHGDGTLGWPEEAPFDAIVVAAAADEVPETLLEQLAVGGRLVLPVGPEGRGQVLTRVVRVDENSYREERLVAVTFVPLVAGVPRR